MKIITSVFLFCLVTLAQAQTSTTIVMPDGTMMVCTTFGTIVTCTNI
jgi:hypothetical protein